MDILPYYAAKLGRPLTEVSTHASVLKDGDQHSITRWDEAALGAPAPSDAKIAKILEMPELPVTVRQVGFLDFMALFTQSEQTDIVGSTDVQVRLFCLMAAGAAVVDLSDPRTIDGVKQLEAAKLIGKGRAAKVLAAEAPSA